MFAMRFCVNKEGGGLGMSLKKVTMPLSHQESGSSSLEVAVGSSRSVKQLLTITQPDDWHLHLRDNDGLAAVAPHSAAVFKRAIIMPNLKPPVTTVAAAVSYQERILKVLPSDSDFEPLMTLYLTDATTKDEIQRARKSGLVKAVKLYPAGATTNSQAGVTDLFGKCMPVLEEMVKQGLPLLVHGEVADSSVDIFDRERVFIETVLEPLVRKLPQLRIVMEHITTKDAVDFISSVPEGQALVAAVTSGSPRYFLGTDSAPHERLTKEAPCGCAGIFSAPIALPLYAQAFEEVGALDKLEAFASFNGPDFYQLPRNSSTITLVKGAWSVPHQYGFGSGSVVPMWAGQNINWSLK
ncbi:unnamed protein product [Sphagnum jensenii]|uniref:dihydroorotase n=1 Tax=Sphagnum jensenii TaxID=128206 RepID=A0ABP1B4K8_9BRYO